MAQIIAITFKYSWSSKQKVVALCDINPIPHCFAPEVHKDLRIPISVPRFEVKLMVFQSDLNNLLWKDS